MNDINLNALIGFIIRVIAILYLTLFIFPKQIREVFRPKSWLTGLRQRILALILFIILTGAPSVMWQFCRAFNIKAPFLQNLTTITGNLSYLGLAVLLGLIYSYRKKD